MHNKTVRFVMAAIRCAVFCVQASTTSKNTSLSAGGRARARSVGFSSRLTVGTLFGSEWEPILLRHTRKRIRLLLKTDVHKILLLPMLGFCGVVVPIRGPTKVCAAHCGVCIEVGFSPFLSISVLHEVAFISLLVACGRSRAPSKMRRAKFLMDPCQHVTKESFWHRQQQQNGRSCSSAACVFGISWNRSHGQYNALNS